MSNYNASMGYALTWCIDVSDQKCLALGTLITELEQMQPLFFMRAL